MLFLINLQKITIIPHPLRNQEYKTLDYIINHLWDVTDKLALESGLRTDKVDASTLNTENGGQSFVPYLKYLLCIKLNSRTFY